MDFNLQISITVSIYGDLTHKNHKNVSLLWSEASKYTVAYIFFGTLVIKSVTIAVTIITVSVVERLWLLLFALLWNFVSSEYG